MNHSTYSVKNLLYQLNLERINKYKNGTLIGQEMVKFKVKGIKQSGASVTDLISK